jgi:hypothetical protein
MTAEICVMNRLAVALAADSAVTLGSSADKIYTSADKLFQLSENAPVGLMIFGNASIVGLPWETVVKVFRARLRGKTFGTTEEYTQNLVAFLSRERTMFRQDRQLTEISQLVKSYYLRILRQIKVRLDDLGKTQTSLADKDIRDVVARVVSRELKEIKGFQTCAGLGSAQVKQIERKHSVLIRSAKEEVFQQLPMAKTSSERLSEIGAELIVRQRFGPLVTGVVVAGFGDKEYLPSVSRVAIESMIDGRPRYYAGPVETIGEKSSAYVIPFAQQEMVHTFMEGIDRDMLSLIERSTSELFKGITVSVVSEVKKKDQRLGKALGLKLTPKLDDLVNELFNNWKQKRRATYWGPIMDIVSALPKDELASMAESLVNLTKFKRRVSTQKESVGGPIDVAVITKGDGFVWVRRKHYFEPQLNPRAMARYARGAR